MVSVFQVKALSPVILSQGDFAPRRHVASSGDIFLLPWLVRGQGATGIYGERLGVMPHIRHRAKQPPPRRVVASQVSVMWDERPSAELYSALQFTWGRCLTSLSLSFRIWKVKIVISALYTCGEHSFWHMVSCQLLLSPPVTLSMSQILECKVSASQKIL